MLSYKMATVLTNPSNRFKNTVQQYRDGRTVRALQARGLIKAVKWNEDKKTWNYKYTAKGIRIAQLLDLTPGKLLLEVLI